MILLELYIDIKRVKKTILGIFLSFFCPLNTLKSKNTLFLAFLCLFGNHAPHIVAPMPDSAAPVPNSATRHSSGSQVAFGSFLFPGFSAF